MRSETLAEPLRQALAWLGPQLIRRADVQRLDRRMDAVEQALAGLEAAVEANLAKARRAQAHLPTPKGVD